MYLQYPERSEVWEKNSVWYWVLLAALGRQETSENSPILDKETQDG